MSRVWWRRSFRLLRVVSPSRQPKENLPGELLDWAIKRTHRTMWGKYNLWEWERTRSIVQTERAWNGRERKEEKKNWRTKSGWTSTKPKDKLKFLNSRVAYLGCNSRKGIWIYLRMAVSFFWDVYRRDIKHPQECQHSKVIRSRSGNSAAHDGDAVGDAFPLRVWQKGQIAPLYVQRELYGLDAIPISYFMHLWCTYGVRI